MFKGFYDRASLHHLTNGWSVIDAAEESRRAAAAFVNGAGAGWTPWDLAHWAAGPYRRATNGADQHRVARMLRSVLRDFHPQLADARSAVLEILEDLAGPYHRIPFVEWAQARGFVVPCFTARGCGWLAACPEDATLPCAVASLFVVDYLLRPLDYAGLLSICPRCRAVAFDAAARARRDCGMHEPNLAAQPAREPRLVENRATKIITPLLVQ
jgi:hypothetical protein